jgi:hypothetical protein
MARIQEMLNQVGLDYRHVREAPEARQRPVAPRKPSDPEDITDETSVEDLGLKLATGRTLLQRGLRTVGDLRSMSLQQLQSALSLRRRHEVYRVLRARGLNLCSNPSELALWRTGLLRIDELTPPADEHRVLDLQPWLGSLAIALDAAGVTCVAQLRTLASRGVVQTSDRGLTPYSWTRVRRYFDMSRSDALELPKSRESGCALRA